MCAREGMAVVGTFDDRQLSGAGAIDQPGFQSLIEDTDASFRDVLSKQSRTRLRTSGGHARIVRRAICRPRVSVVWPSSRSLAPMRAPGCRYFVRLGTSWPKWRQQ